jgi:hypothetical protein
MTRLLIRLILLQFSLILFSSAQLAAQTFDWAVKDSAFQLAADQSGNLITFHTSILKGYSNTGTLSWSKPVPQGLTITRICGVKDGGAVFTGTFNSFTWSGLTITAANGTGKVLGRLSANGTLIWAKEININAADEIVDLDYSITRIISIAVNYEASSFTILFYNEHGNYVTSYEPVKGGKLMEICSDKNGALVLIGSVSDTLEFQNGDSYVYAGGPALQYMANLTPSFQFSWSYYMGVCYYAPYVKLRTDLNNNIYLTKWQRYDGFDVVSYNSSGQFRWTRSMEAIYGGCNDVALDGNGDCWVVGDIWGGPNNPDSYFWQLDNAGNLKNTYYSYSETMGKVLATDGLATIYIAGNFIDSLQHSNGILTGSGPYLAKLSNVVTKLEKISDHDNIMVYPNPSSGSFIISGLKSDHISISDLKGNIIINEIAVKGGKAEVDLKDHAKGIYIIIADDKRRRIVLQ